MTTGTTDSGHEILKAVRHGIKKSSVSAILADLVSIPSSDQEEGIIDYLGDRFAALGLPLEIIPVAGEKRCNLVVRWGDGPHSLILNTHMDTVSPGDHTFWSRAPYAAEIVGDQLYGRGAADAKGSLAAMVAAFEAVVRCGHSLGGTLILTAVACEETRGKGTRNIVEQNLRAEVAVVGEPTGLAVHIAHKGLVRFRISAVGRAAHASRPTEGINAISALAVLVTDLDELARDIGGQTDPLLGHASLVVTRIEGGEADNVVPETCTVGVDRRLLPGETVAEATDQIERIARGMKDRFPGIDLDVVATHSLNAAQTDPEHGIVDHAVRCRQDVTGESSPPVGFPACCDMVYLSEAGIPTIILGPGDLAQAHVVDEHVSLAQVFQAAKIYAGIAVSWLNRPTDRSR